LPPKTQMVITAEINRITKPLTLEFLCQIRQENSPCWACILVSHPKRKLRKIKEITLVDKRVLVNNGIFSENTNLYRTKIPNNFQQCVIKGASIGFHPFVSLIRNETKEDGNIVFDIHYDIVYDIQTTGHPIL